MTETGRSEVDCLDLVGWALTERDCRKMQCRFLSCDGNTSAKCALPGCRCVASSRQNSGDAKGPWLSSDVPPAPATSMQRTSSWGAGISWGAGLFVGLEFVLESQVGSDPLGSWLGPVIENPCGLRVHGVS